jgi:hypothetical protein
MTNDYGSQFSLTVDADFFTKLIAENTELGRCTRTPNVPYSFRSVIAGSTLDARRAGQ